MRPQLATQSQAEDMDIAADQCLDLAHLSRQTLGDAALERELMQLFDRQVRQFMPRLLSSSADGLAEQARLAHTLKGSALSIGAHELAAAAGALEQALMARAPDLENKRSSLIGAIERTLAKIAELL